MVERGGGGLNWRGWGAGGGWNGRHASGVPEWEHSGVGWVGGGMRVGKIPSADLGLNSGLTLNEGAEGLREAKP